MAGYGGFVFCTTDQRAHVDATKNNSVHSVALRVYIYAQLRGQMEIRFTSRIFSLLAFAAVGLMSVSLNAGVESGMPRQDASAPNSNYAPAIFHAPIPSDQLAFLNKYADAMTKDVLKDGKLKKLLKAAIPACTFHYGRDMPMQEAVESVLSNSLQAVQIRDGRYVTISGESGPYLLGRGFLWFDLRDGIALGGFYYKPTNGEPTPTLSIFSGQVKEEAITMSQLPPAFGQDLSRWSREERIPPVVTRYFITNSNRRLLLEHSENFCMPLEGMAPAANCKQMNVDAADADLNASLYLQQTSYATNGTARMITGQEQLSWARNRDDTCRTDPDPPGCHIRMTRVRINIIIVKR